MQGGKGGAIVPPDLEELMASYVQKTKRIAEECQKVLEMKRGEYMYAPAEDSATRSAGSATLR